jgi:hypothetical protein
MRPVERVLEKLEVASGPDARGEYVAFCPAHDDRNTPNLRIREARDADGRILLRCFAGCGQDEVLAALAERGIRKKDLFAGGKKEREGGEGGCIPPEIMCTRAHVPPTPRPRGCPSGFSGASGSHSGTRKC